MSLFDHSPKRNIRATVVMPDPHSHARIPIPKQLVTHNIQLTGVLYEANEEANTRGMQAATEKARCKSHIEDYIQ